MWAERVMPKAWRARSAMNAFIHHKQVLHDAERAHVFRAQQEATWVVGGTALAAVLVALLGGSRLVRSASRTYAAETQAHTAFVHLAVAHEGLIAVLRDGRQGGLVEAAGRVCLDHDEVPRLPRSIDDELEVDPAFDLTL